MFRYVFTAMLVVVLVTTACGFTINLPKISVTPGPDVIDQIKVEKPDVDRPVSLALAFGAGEIKLAPGSGTMLVSGTATYNMPDFKPLVTVDGPDVRIEQGKSTVRGIPNFDGLKNIWDLKLGSTPMDLKISAGAYKAEYDFSGLALTSLTVNDGAADVKMKFSAPNPSKMDILRYETGASNVTLTGLGNANFNTLIFKSGAGNYTLDFTGSLQRDATISLESGLSNVTFIIPKGTPAKLTVEAGLTNISLADGWEKKGNDYIQSGSGPALTFVVKMGAGNLTITQ
jgi:hypothetical protein